MRDALAGLIKLSGLGLVDRGGTLQSPPGQLPLLIGDEELGSDADAPGSSKFTRSRSPDGAMPAALTLTYYDPERDYQAGQTRASSGNGGARDERLELPAVLAAPEARTMAEQALARRWLAGDRLKLQLPPKRIGLHPGDPTQLPGGQRPWIAGSVSIEGMPTVIEAEAAPVIVQPLPADPGRTVSEPDIPVGRSELALFELPPVGDAPGPSPRAFVGGSNEGRWKSLPVELTLEGQPMPGLAIGRKSVLGWAQSVLDDRSPQVVDEQSQVIVQLVDHGQILFNADLEGMVAGANLALIGDELVQFGRAEQIGAGLFRLSRLLRGRRGTEWAAAGHAGGEPFCMIDPARLGSVSLPASAIGASLVATAHGVGDTAPLPQSGRTISGEAMRPPPPCHLAAARTGPDLAVSWVRRSHRHWAWVDGVGDGADGFPERYRLAITGPGGSTEVEIFAPSVLIEQSQVPAETGHPISLAVATVGPAALSHAATINLIF